MPCTSPVNRNSKECATWPPCSDPTNSDPRDPNCDKRVSVTARVITMEVQTTDVLITIAAGSDQKIAKGWAGTVLRGDSEAALEGGKVVVVRVGKRETGGQSSPPSRPDQCKSARETLAAAIVKWAHGARRGLWLLGCFAEPAESGPPAIHSERLAMESVTDFSDVDSTNDNAWPSASIILLLKGEKKIMDRRIHHATNKLAH